MMAILDPVNFYINFMINLSVIKINVKKKKASWKFDWDYADSTGHLRIIPKQ